MKQVASEAALDDLSIETCIINWLQETTNIDLHLRQCDGLESLKKALTWIFKSRILHFLAKNFYKVRSVLSDASELFLSVLGQETAVLQQGEFSFQRPQKNPSNSSQYLPRNQSTPALRTPVSRLRHSFRPSPTFLNTIIKHD